MLLWLVILGWSHHGIAESAKPSATHTKPSALKSSELANGSFAKAKRAFDQKSFEEAAALFDSFARQFPADARVAEALFLGGLSQIRQKESSAQEQGLRTWQWLLANYPDAKRAGDALAEMAVYYEKKSNPVQAAALRLKLQREHPTHPIARKLSIANIQQKLDAGDHAAASVLFERVKGSLLEQERTALAAAFARAKPVGATLAVSELVARAEEIAGAGHHAAAVEAYDEILRRPAAPSRWAETNWHKGNSLFAMGKFSEAAEAWKLALDGADSAQWKPECLFSLGHVRAFRLNEPDIAITLYERFLAEFPKHPRMAEARYQLAGVFFHQGRHQEAVERFEALIRDHPHTSLAGKAEEWLAKSRAALARQSKQATSPAQAAARTDSSNSSDDLFAQALAAVTKGEYARARPLLERFLHSSNLHPKVADARVLYADVLAHTGNAPRALEEYERAARLHPGTPSAVQAACAIVELCLEKGKIDDARKAARLLPGGVTAQSAAVVWKLAIALLLDGKTGDAREWFARLASSSLATKDTAAAARLIAEWDTATRQSPNTADFSAASLLLTAANEFAVYGGDYKKAEDLYVRIAARWPGFRPDEILFKRAANQLDADMPDSIPAASRLLGRSHQNSPTARALPRRSFGYASSRLAI